MPDSADFQEFLNHLTENALMSIKQAELFAHSQGSAYVGTEHLLLGVLSQKTSMERACLAAQVLIFKMPNLH